MAIRAIYKIFILGMASSIVALRHPNFTAACEEVRLGMIARNSSLENETQLQCGAEYSPKTLPAIPITVDLEACKLKWPGWQKSRLDALNQWLGPLVGFLLPAMIFVISIPRDPRFQLPRGEDFFDRNIFLSIVWVVLMFLLVAVEVILWIITVFSFAGPMMAGAMDEGIKDWRILRKVEKVEKAKNPTNQTSSGGASFGKRQKRYALALVLVGTFDPRSADLAQNVITEICDAPDVDNAKKILHQWLNWQGSYGVQVGAPVVFYIGAYAYALFEARSRLGDNDTAHAIAFGLWYGNLVLTATACCAILGLSKSAPLEAVFGGRSVRARSERAAPYQAVWLWNRGRCVRSWVELTKTLPQAPIHESIRHILKSRANRVLAAGLSIVAIAIPCSFAIIISYYTPIVGFGCRATTVLCYGCCQVALILCWLFYKPKACSQWIVYPVGAVCIGFSMFLSIGGTVMQLLGVYKNCVCKAGLKYWVNPTGGIVSLATDTQEHRDSGELWFRLGVAGLISIGVFCIFSWGYFMRMKAKLAKQINALTNLP